MNTWEQVTINAQNAYDDKVFQEAARMYQSALAIAIAEFLDLFETKSHKAMAAVMISYINLIDCHIATKDSSAAYQVFQDSFSFIHSVACQETLTSKQVLALYKGSSKLHLECLLFLKHYSHWLSTQQQDCLNNALKSLLADRAYIH